MMIAQFRIDLTPEQVQQFAKLWIKHGSPKGAAFLCQPRWVIQDGTGYLMGCLMSPEEAQALLATLENANVARCSNN